MEIESKQRILKRRKEIEKELLEMLKETDPPSSASWRTTERAGSDFGLDEIKEIIYNEDGQDCLTDIIAMFDRGGDASELSTVLELLTDAWNYFPHKVSKELSELREKGLVIFDIQKIRNFICWNKEIQSKGDPN